MIQKSYILLLVFITHNGFSQRNNSSVEDSLSNKSFDYLYEQYGNNIYDPSKTKIYVSALLKKAKAEKRNFKHLTLAYKSCILNVDKSLRLLYADSMITNAKKTNSDELIGSSYITKGIVHYNRLEHSKALDNLLIADQYIARVDNPALVHKAKYEISKIKYYLGFYHEAISLIRECVTFFKEENDHAYLNSLHVLSMCYTKIGKHDLATEINNLGIKNGRVFEDTRMECYFILSEGINQCHKHNYNVAINMLNTALPNIIQAKDQANQSIAYFYLGKSNWELKNFETAIGYFKKIDKLFQEENYILPELRKGYEYLIDYYKQKNDTDAQLYYINQLLKVDKILGQDYKYLLKKIVKEYDTKELIMAKSKIENAMVLTRIAACLLLSIMAGIIIHLIRKNKKNQRLFDELMNRNTALPKEINESEEVILLTGTESDKLPTTPDINPELEAAIIKRLEKFELTKKYLEKDMNLSKMATLLQTNSKYVTKIVAKHRGKGAIEYITGLKLDYIVEMLKTDSKYRNYTNTALAEEAGFRTTQNFTRAFKKHTGITPTYFSYKLKKSTTTDNEQ